MSNYTRFPQHAWEPAHLILVDAEPYYVSQAWSRFITLEPPPPDADSECDAVIKAGQDRAERKEEVREQGGALHLQLWPIIEALRLSGVTKENWSPEDEAVTGVQLPHTWEMLRAALWDMQCGLYALKLRFNRGRPVHAFGSKIGVTSLRTPGHPAYPAGHAAQSHVSVLLLETALKRMKQVPANMPRLLDDMLRAGERVAENRVVAGIHFPSDTVAGKDLALQYVPMLLRSTLFGRVVAAAARELEQFFPAP